MLPSPAFDDDPRLREGVEALSVRQRVTELAVEALAAAVLPRAARLDEGGLRPSGRPPFSHGLGDEFRAMIGTDAARHAAQDEEVRQDADDVRRLQLPVDPDRQALAGERVDDVQQAQRPAVVGAVLDDVVGPDVVGPLGSKPHAGAVGQPQTALLRLPPRSFQPLQPPDALDPLSVDRPTGRSQHRGDPAAAVAAVFGRQRDDVRGERRVVGAPFRRLSLRGTVLPQHAARHPLGHVGRPHHVTDEAATAGGAQSFPQAASRRTSFSSVRSETAWRSRSFSFSSSFSLTLPPRTPPIQGQAGLLERRDADAQEPVQRRADRRDPDGARSGPGHGGAVPQGRGSATPRSASGGRAMAAWSRATRSVCDHWKKRTPGSRSCWRSRSWTSRRCERCSEKTSDARFEEERRELGHDQEALFAAPRLRAGRDRAETVRYASTRPDDGELRDRLKTLAEERGRFSYRRLHILLRREGVGVNHGRRAPRPLRGRASL